MAEKPKFEIVNFLPNDYLFIEGKRADAFYIIREGYVQVTGAAQTLAGEDDKYLGPGDLLGVVSVLSDHSHIDSAQADSDVSLIAVRRKQFIGLIQHNSSVAMKIILEFSKRTRFLNDAIAAAINKPISTSEDTTVLYHTGEYYEKIKRRARAYYAYQKYIERFPDGEFAAQASEKMEALKDSAPPMVQQGAGRMYAKGSFIFAEGELGNELFVLLSGSVQICKVIDGSEMIFAILKQGDIFGEMALLEDKPRSASAIAYEDCSVLIIKKENFERMAISNPQIIDRLTKMLADRIWFSYKQLANYLVEDPVGRMYDAIVMHFEKNHENMDSRSGGIARRRLLNFGPKELAKMCGIPDDALVDALERIDEEKKIQYNDKQIMCLDNAELVKTVEFYKSVQRRQKEREKSKPMSISKSKSKI
jgi:CRP-like cAMP-binding protein